MVVKDLEEQRTFTEPRQRRSRVAGARSEVSNCTVVLYFIGGLPVLPHFRSFSKRDGVLDSTPSVPFIEKPSNLYLSKVVRLKIEEVRHM